MLIGGTEKLRGEPDYGVPIVEEPGDAEIVVDLSDEPVLDAASCGSRSRRASSRSGCRTSAPTSASTRRRSTRSSCRRSR